MQLKISTNDLTEMVLNNTFPENYHDAASAVTERVTHIDNALGKGSYREIFFEGIHIAYGDIRFRNETQLFFESDYETVEMHFDLCGGSLTDISGAGDRTYAFSTNRHNIIYVPGIKGNIRFGASNKQMLEINLRPSLFSRYLQDSDTFRDFLDLIKKQTPALMSKHNMPITPAMLNIILSITGCTRNGIYKKIFLESKVIELLLLQLEQFSTHNCDVFCSIKPTDVGKIYNAKEIILKQLHNPCSLIDLARQVGTNEFTLKKGFKEVFGTTVFGMVTEIKLKHAKELLLSGEKSIAEVSRQSGYKYQGHFTKAFKKQFGVPPTKINDTNAFP